VLKIKWQVSLSEQTLQLLQKVIRLVPFVKRLKEQVLHFLLSIEIAGAQFKKYN
jgi:hypothetical protein